MEIELSKKEIKFLYALLGPMSDADYEKWIDKSQTEDESEKEKIRKFIKKQKAYGLYNKIAEIMEGGNE